MRLLANASLLVLWMALGCVQCTIETDSSAQEEDNIELKEKLQIFPESALSGYSHVKRVDETLNLTCRVIKDSNMYTKFHLRWTLPQSKDDLRIQIHHKPGSINTLQLTVKKLQESDSGKYRCDATNDSVTLHSSIDISVMQKKGACGDGMFLCTKVNSCISKRYLCDGKDDCQDGADESRQICGDVPCDGKLQCDDGRCIPKKYCCDKHEDPNCTAVYEIPCCRKLLINSIRTDFGQPNYSDIGYLQSTMYTIIGCAVALVLIVTLTVIAVCRVHMRRSALGNVYAAYRSDRRVWSDLDSYLATNGRWTREFLRSDLSRSPGLVLNSYGVSEPSANTLLVTYNINNGVQLMSRPMEPPPYEEVTSVQGSREEPPPPYASRDNLNQNLFSMLVSHSQNERIEEDNNNGDINGNNTPQVNVQANSNDEPTVQLSRYERQNAAVDSARRCQTNSEAQNPPL